MNESFESSEPVSSFAPRGPRLRVVPGGGASALPHSEEAEARFLATCFLDATVAARAQAQLLLPRHFYVAAHGILWAKICEVAAGGYPPSLDLVAEQLKLSGELDQVGGYKFLAEVTQAAPTSLEAMRHMELVLDYALVRQGIRESRTVGEALAGWSGGPLEGVMGKFALTFQRMSDFAMRRKRASQVEIAQAARKASQDVAAGRVDKTRWLHLGGLPHADQAFLAFDVRNEDWLILLAGPPSGGKSTLLRQHLGHQLLLGKRVVLFLLETSTRRWLQSLAAMFAGVNVRELDREPPDRVKVFDNWMAEIEGWMDTCLWVFDDIFFLEDIERQVRELNRRLIEKDLSAGLPVEQARGLDAVGGDYIQLLDTREKFKQREQQVSLISKSLKRLHKGIDVPGFWAVQLNRGPRSEGRRPKLTDLRESGSLEQDADGVIALHTPEENKAGIKQDGSRAQDEVELIQLKRRNGPRDVAVDLIFHKRWGRYEDAQNRGGVRPGMPKPKDGYKRNSDAC
jgi:replicative DNA helicase